MGSSTSRAAGAPPLIIECSMSKAQEPISWIGWRGCMFAVIQFESRTMKDLTDYCFAYLQNHSPRFFTDNFGGALVKRVNRFAASSSVRFTTAAPVAVTLR